MSNTLAPSVTARDPKGLKFLSIVEAAYNKARLSEEEAQRINDTSGLAELVASFIAENRLPNQFADEEVESSYAYPKGYKVKGITEQTNILRQLFPGIGFADEKLAEQPLPPNAEGWFAIPKWQTLAPTYGEAVEKVLAMIASKRKFYNYREGELGPDRLRQSQRTIEMLKKIGETQQGDILIIPGQFGMRHRGRSIRRAHAVFQASEFGFGAFAAGCMLLTHPERLEKYEDLFIDCAGDEYDYPGGVVRFDFAPFFDFRGGEVEFDARWVGSACDCYGAASGWLPQ